MKMTKEILNKQMSRKDFLKMSGFLAAGLVAIPVAGMFKPVTNLFNGGKTTTATTNYETIIQEWWKWYYGGMQTKPIFGMQFLAGTSGGYAERTMMVQAGNTVFFSPLNFLGKPENNDITPNAVYDVKTNIPVTNLGRIISPKPFSIGLKDEKGVMMNDVISDGYWVVGGPLTPGNYDLNMWGVNADGKFKNSVKYGLIVI